MLGSAGSVQRGPSSDPIGTRRGVRWEVPAVQVPQLWSTRKVKIKSGTDVLVTHPSPLPVAVSLSLLGKRGAAAEWGGSFVSSSSEEIRGGGPHCILDSRLPPHRILNAHPRLSRLSALVYLG